MRLEGTVRDAEGQPVAGAMVETWMRCGLPLENGQSFYVIPERVDREERPIRTDDRGSFRVTATVRAGSTYRVVVRADGFAPVVSDWIVLKDRSATLPVVTIRRQRTIAGRVADRQGRAIAGVEVFEAGGGRSATTDEAGRFRQVGARPGRSFLLARREGFVFGGTRNEGREDLPVELVLTRPGEPPVRTMATLPDPIPAEECRALARRVLGPYLKRAVAEGDDAAKSWSLRVLGWLDPAGMFEQVQKTRFDQQIKADYLHADAALGMLPTDPDDAVAIAEAIVDPSVRAGALVNLADATPAADRARKVRCSTGRRSRPGPAASPRTSSSRSERSPSGGSSWARRRRHGAVRRGPEGGGSGASSIADERRFVPGPPGAGRAGRAAGIDRECRAGAMAGANLRKHCDPAGVRASGRGRGGARPDRGADLAGVRRSPGSAADWPATSRPARAGSPTTCPIRPSAYAWTFLADGLVAGDRTAAGAALDRALREIDSIDAGDLSRASEPNPAASILPLVERIAPERVAEVFWRAIALSAPGDDPRIDFGRDTPLPRVAALLSRYDREAATALFEPVAAFVRSRALREANDIIPDVLVAQTCLDPRTAVEVVEALPPAKTPGIIEPTNWARITVAELLAKPPDRRWMGIWRFYSGCGIAMFEDVYRGL